MQDIRERVIAELVVSPLLTITEDSFMIWVHEHMLPEDFDTMCAFRDTWGVNAAREWWDETFRQFETRGTCVIMDNHMMPVTIAA